MSRSGSSSTTNLNPRLDERPFGTRLAGRTTRENSIHSGGNDSAGAYSAEGDDPELSAFCRNRDRQLRSTRPVSGHAAEPLHGAICRLRAPLRFHHGDTRGISGQDLGRFLSGSVTQRPNRDPTTLEISPTPYCSPPPTRRRRERPEKSIAPCCSSACSTKVENSLNFPSPKNTPP
jgi:hypothetical protein